MKMSTTIEKLGGIPSVSLPVCVCGNAPCRGKGCYACKGRWKFKTVQDGLEENLTEFLTNQEKFFEDVINAIDNGIVIYKRFRWFSSGDIVNADFLAGMVKVAKACKVTKFLVFTKKFDIVNKYLQDGGKIPSNLKIVFSAWDKDFKIDNPFNFPVAYINFKDKKRNPQIPLNAIPCNGECSHCLACWDLKKKQAVQFNQH